MRKCWVYIDGVPYEKGTEPTRRAGGSGPAIMGDLPDFVSPIDGTIVRGRAGLRDHCVKHDVVPTEDLKGLPWLTSQTDQRSPEQKRADAEHRKRIMINEVDKQYRRYNG